MSVLRLPTNGMLISNSLFSKKWGIDRYPGHAAAHPCLAPHQPSARWAKLLRHLSHPIAKDVCLQCPKRHWQHGGVASAAKPDAGPRNLAVVRAVVTALPRQSRRSRQDHSPWLAASIFEPNWPVVLMFIACSAIHSGLVSAQQAVCRTTRAGPADGDPAV